MLKVKFDWSKNKFQQAANAVNAQAAAAAAAAAAAVNSSNTINHSTNARPSSLALPSTSTIGRDQQQPSSIATAPRQRMNHHGVISNGPYSSNSITIDDGLESRMTTFGSGSQSAFSTNIGSSGPTGKEICCLAEEGIRCNRTAGNASYSKRIQKTVTQKRLRLNIDNAARHIYICEYHKNMIQSVRASTKRKRKDSGDDDGSNDGFPLSAYEEMGYVPDLGALQVNTLRRFKKHYRIQTRPGINKSQLVEQLHRHFRTIPVNDKEAITFFIYMVKMNKNKLDHKGALND